MVKHPDWINKIDTLPPLSREQIAQIAEEYERLRDKYSEREFEELTGLMAIVVNSRQPQSENWKRLCYSIFDVLTQFKNLGLLRLTHESKKLKAGVWNKLEKEVYKKYREIVWDDYSIKIKEFKEQIIAEIIKNE